MKRTIIVEVLLLFILGVLIALSIPQWQKVDFWLSAIRSVTESKTVQSTKDVVIPNYLDNMKPYLIYGILALLAALATLTAMIIIAIKDFPCFKPLVDKLNAKRAARKQAHTEQEQIRKQARAEQEQIRKQERIIELQAELDALKKDDNASL